MEKKTTGKQLSKEGPVGPGAQQVAREKAICPCDKAGRQ